MTSLTVSTRRRSCAAQRWRQGAHRGEVGQGGEHDGDGGVGERGEELVELVGEPGGVEPGREEHVVAADEHRDQVGLQGDGLGQLPLDGVTGAVATHGEVGERHLGRGLAEVLGQQRGPPAQAASGQRITEALAERIADGDVRGPRTPLLRGERDADDMLTTVLHSQPL